MKPITTYIIESKIFSIEEYIEACSFDESELLGDIMLNEGLWAWLKKLWNKLFGTAKTRIEKYGDYNLPIRVLAAIEDEPSKKTQDYKPDKKDPKFKLVVADMPVSNFEKYIKTTKSTVPKGPFYQAWQYHDENPKYYILSVTEDGQKDKNYVIGFKFIKVIGKDKKDTMVVLDEFIPLKILKNNIKETILDEINKQSTELMKKRKGIKVLTDDEAKEFLKDSKKNKSEDKNTNDNVYLSDEVIKKIKSIKNIKTRKVDQDEFNKITNDQKEEFKMAIEYQEKNSDYITGAMEIEIKKKTYVIGFMFISKTKDTYKLENILLCNQLIKDNPDTLDEEFRKLEYNSLVDLLDDLGKENEEDIELSKKVEKELGDVAPETSEKHEIPDKGEDKTYTIPENVIDDIIKGKTSRILTVDISNDLFERWLRKENVTSSDSPYKDTILYYNDHKDDMIFYIDAETKGNSFERIGFIFGTPEKDEDDNIIEFVINNISLYNKLMEDGIPMLSKKIFDDELLPGIKMWLKANNGDDAEISYYGDAKKQYDGMK